MNAIWQKFKQLANNEHVNINIKMQIQILEAMHHIDLSMPPSFPIVFLSGLQTKAMYNQGFLSEDKSTVKLSEFRKFFIRISPSSTLISSRMTSLL